MLTLNETNGRRNGRNNQEANSETFVKVSAIFFCVVNVSRLAKRDDAFKRSCLQYS